MKNLNFLTDLRNSNQVMTRLRPGNNQVKTTLRFIAILTLLTLSVGQMWGTDATFSWTAGGTMGSNATGKQGNITLTGAANSASGAPAVTSNTLRLYAHRSSGNGASATFTADDGYQITAIAVTSSNGGTILKYSVDGGSYTTFSWSSGSSTISNLTASAITLKNCQNSGKSNTTIQVASVVVTYESTGGGSTPVTGVSVSPTSKSIVPGETFTITPTVAPAGATDKTVSWTSSATSYATVNSSGLVTGVAAGSSTVRCTTTDGSFTADCAVTVYGVTMQAKADDGNGGLEDIGVGGPGAPTRSGTTITAAANSGNYVFKQWSITNATAASTTTSPTTLSNPTGNVTVTAVYYKPITITYKANNTTFTTQTYARGGTLAFPASNPDGATYSCTGKTFVGWVGEANKDYSHASTPPTYATAGGSVTAAATYYAVFADATPGGVSWDQITDATDVTAGTYVIVASTSTNTGYLPTAESTDTGPTYTTSGLTISEGKITSSVTDAMKWTFSTGSWDDTYDYMEGISITNQDDTPLYLNNTSANNGVRVDDTDDKTWTIGNHESGTADVLYMWCNGRYCGVYNNADWRSYTTYDATNYTAATGSSKILLFKETDLRTYSNYETNCCEAPASALSITSANSVATGGTVSLTSTGGNGGTVTWSVVNGTGTATVAGSTLTAGSIGTVTVKAHQDANTVLGTEYCAQDAEQAFTVVSSTVNVTGVEVSPTSKAIVPGETFDITPTISPSNATDKSVSWTSSASDKASVSSGTVTGVAAGTANITCTTTDGSYTATCAVTVRDVTLQARDEDGNTIAAGGPGAPSRSGATITAAANAGNYVFKQWQVTNASVASTTTTPTTISNPTGAVTVTAVYYKPRVIKWSVGGDDSYDEGSPTLTVAYNGTISAVPDAPDDDALSCANKFMGWSTKSAAATPKTTSYYDDLFTNASGYTANITDATKTFYAVFAEVDEGNWTLDYSEEEALRNSTSWGSYGTAYNYTASDGGTWTVKANKNSGMQINNGKNSSIKIPNCSGDITSIVVTGTNKTVRFSQSDYDGSTYGDIEVTGSDAYTQTLDFTGKSISAGYIVPKTNANAITRIVVNYGSTSNYVTECDATKAKVTYDLNGGTGGCATGLYTKDGFTVCNTAVTRTGYTFSGWNDGTSTYAAGAAYTLTTNVTFTAQWTPVEYTITYNLDGGTNNIGNPASYTIESSDITLLTPTKTAGGYEYDFTGWTDDDDSDAPITTIASGSTGNKHVTATWAQKKRVQWYVGNTVQWTTFYASNGSGSLTLPNGGTPPSVPPTCGSKVFVGWTSDTPWDGETDTEPTVLFKAASGTVSDDANYYAVWADEHSEEAEGEIFSDAFNISGTNEVTSRDGWSSLSKLYGGSGSIRFSTGGGAGTMTLVKTGLGFGTTVTEATITFKIKKYGSDGSGVLSVSSNFSDATTTFSKDGGKTTSTSAQYSTTDGTNWTTCTCTVGSISASTDIILEGQTNSRVYVKDFSIEASGTTYTYDKYAIVCCNDPELEFGQTRYSLIREDLHGNTSAAYSTIELTYSSSSSGAIHVWTQYDEDDNPEHSTKTAWQYTGANTWGTSPTTGGSAATASSHAYFEITDAANGKATFYVKNTAGNTQGQGTYRIALHQAANGGYCETVTYCWIDVTLRDKFVDNVNGNTFPNADGHGPGGAAVSTPAENTRDADKDDDCHETTRRLVGWVKETDMDTWYGSSSDRTRDLDDKKDDAKLVAPGATITTSGATWYAVWGEEVTE